MGKARKIFDIIFGRDRKQDRLAGGELFGNHPITLSYNGAMYRQVLVRSVIERFATASSKLKPEIRGNARPRIRRAVETSPNQYQTWPAFLARCATIYMNNTNLFVVPVYDEEGIQSGFYPLNYLSAAVVMYDGEPWIRFQCTDGDVRAIELKYVALVTRFAYQSDWFGDGNSLDRTLALLEAQEQAQQNAMQSGAAIRFIASVNGQMREEDMAKKRDRFAADNLGADNTSGLMIYDSTFSDVKQVEPYSWTISGDEMTRIENNVFDYFGVNRQILQNNYDENTWDSYYEGVVEPFALQLGESLSQATFTMRERPRNQIMFSANRLEYASAASKRNMAKDMADRAVMRIDEIRDMLQLPYIDGSDVFVLRGEYKVGKDLNEVFEAQRAQANGNSVASEGEDLDPSDADLVRADSEGHGNAGDTDTGDAKTTSQDRWDG